MKELKKRFLKNFQAGERGFTLIELLIVIAILGILAAVIIPNVSGFIVSGKVGAANGELAAVQTASQAYYADNGAWPSTSADLSPGYLTAAPKIVYDFSTTGAASPEGVVSGKVTWNSTDMHWSGTQFIK